MLTVHHLGVSQSDRIVWLCEELGLDYQLVRHERDPVTRLAPEAYRALHPAGTAPVIEDDGLALAESGAIIEYIVAKHGGGRLALGPDHPRYADYLYWYHFAAGSLMPAMMQLGDKGQLAKIMGERVERYMAAIEAHLAQGNTWLAGDDFTVADIIIAFPLTTMRLFVPLDLAPFPEIRGYVARIGARPAFARAMAKADPDLVIPLS